MCVSRTFASYDSTSIRPYPEVTIHSFTSSHSVSNGMSTGQMSSHAPQPVHSHEFRAKSSPGFTFRRRSRSRGPRISYWRRAKIRPRGEAPSQPASWYAGHYGRVFRGRSRHALELRKLLSLAATELLEGDLHADFRDRGVREVVEPQAFYDGPDGPPESVRLLPTLGGHGTRPPPKPCAPLDTGERISRFGTDAGESAEAQMPQPNCFFAVSDIISGVHGGSQTMSTFASLIPGSCSSFRFTSWWMYADAGQPGAVSVILTSTLPSSPFRSMLYTRPRS